MSLDNMHQSDMIMSAAAGDQVALTQLIVAYRREAVLWARDILRDTSLAEDAVQESFLRMAAKLSGLRDPERFRPWLRRLVRRTAINMLRGAESRTKPFSDLPEAADPYLASRPADPMQQILDRDTRREVAARSSCTLRGNEKHVMDAMVGGLQPDEVASSLGIARSNVYNLISRSRSKLNEDRFRMGVDRYLASRRDEGGPNCIVLEEPRFSRPYAFLSVALLEVMRYVSDREQSLTTIMGLTGDAFRIGISSGCDWRGLSTFDWSFAFYGAAERVGWSARCFGRPGRQQILPEQQVGVLRLIHDAVKAGRPAIVWNLTINEFDLIYGYDDMERVLFGRSHRPGLNRYTYESLGRSSESPGLFAAILDRRTGVPTSLRTVLGGIVKQIRGDEPRVPGFAFGQAAYLEWRSAVLEDRLDPLGHAYQVALLSEAREHACRYLERLSRDRQVREEARSLLAAASSLYGQISRTMLQLYPAFPFGMGGITSNREQIAAGLKAAMEAEAEAAGFLEAALERI
ncbi:sigma-70 family RNA polymerase sigma factor [Paenibacillus oenotherae]|uniref:Sigma-70 family RNA polymerase sigma factor n=1 Tax=Paenibacillus oenotherae TaxID=1435645 RepID=A0ABS7D6L4_9BACL|nr:sigma-70 family RNA polymerase sigma factor [Paenibacillus oenotherae]MBW7475577.1 sigma-70 family RNA polymerase sigma factor [Paenibacillus oenotherae]